MEISKLVRPSILALRGYSSARDEYSGGKATLLDANENPFPTEVNRYPDPYQRALKNELSLIKNIDVENIFLGNGSDEAIDLIIRIFCEPTIENTVIVEPTYGMYQVSAAINYVEVLRSSLDSNFQLDSEQVLNTVNQHTKVVFLCSPNNPSGNDLARDEIEKVITQFEGIVVLDEAYIDFSKENSFINELSKYDNLIVLQTFSKAWGMAGVRLGMAFASKEIISFFNKIKPPYNISALTQEYALNALKKHEEVDEKIKKLISERERLSHVFTEIECIKEIFPSSSNFLLVRFENANAIFSYLSDLDIIVRDRTRVKHGENCLRITIGTREENDQLITALKKL